jgi:hypothetical protein
MKIAQSRNLACVLFLLALPGAGVTLPWDKDMQDQPTMKAQESLVALNASSVPVGGKAGSPPPQDVIELVRARLDAGRTLVNPIASLAMPFYRQAITPEDRWHVVNFIKEVFGGP